MGTHSMVMIYQIRKILHLSGQILQGPSVWGSNDKTNPERTAFTIKWLCGLKMITLNIFGGNTATSFCFFLLCWGAEPNIELEKCLTASRHPTSGLLKEHFIIYRKPMA